MTDERRAKLGWSSDWQAALDTLSTPELQPGRVAQVTRSFCQVLTAEGEETLRIPGRLRHRHRNPAELPAVGDWVAYVPGVEGREGTVEHVLPRRGVIVRQAPGRRGALIEQVIAANVDTVFIVVGLDRDYNLRRIERYLYLVHQGTAKPVLVLNKTDLCDRLDDRRGEIAERWPELAVQPVSALERSSIEPLRRFLESGTTVAFLGSSGAGKSTLINALLGYERQETGDVSQAVGKGRHTTTRRELIELGCGALLIDNPGMREIQLSGDSDELGAIFDEIEELASSCHFNDCRHKSEPGCAVRRAVADGRLDDERYLAYLKLQQELDGRRLRSTLGSEAAEKERWRPVSKALRRKKRGDWNDDH